MPDGCVTVLARPQANDSIKTARIEGEAAAAASKTSLGWAAKPKQP